MKQILFPLMLAFGVATVAYAQSPDSARRFLIGTC